MKPALKILIVVGLTVAVITAVVLKRNHKNSDTASGSSPSAAAAQVASGSDASSAREPTRSTPVATAKLSKLLDLGADKCIPCKMMAPILEELKREYAGRLEVEFIDVWKNPGAGQRCGIQMIPTQIFYDEEGKERFRHVGFLGKEDILAKWKELGVDLSAKQRPGVVREEPVRADTRPRDKVCFMCDGNIDAKTTTVVKGQSEQRIFCSPHCYFVYFSSLVGADPNTDDTKVSVTDCVSGNLVPDPAAVYIYGMDAKGRPTTKALGDKEAATNQQQSCGGNLLTWEMLRSKELATRCAFCDRAVYPEDACVVKFGSTRGYGCCTHCSLGVAARFKQDIEIEANDGLTGQPIRLKTLDGRIASIDPPDSHCVVWPNEKRRRPVAFRRLLQAGILCQPRQLAEVAGRPSGNDRPPNHDCAGAG